MFRFAASVTIADAEGLRLNLLALMISAVLSVSPTLPAIARGKSDGSLLVSLLASRSQEQRVRTEAACADDG
jgi:hypothetical protein